MDNRTKVIKEVERLTYKQNWKVYNNIKTREKLMALSLLEELLDLIRDDDKDSMYTLKEQILCMFVYCYSQASARRVMSDIELIRIKCGLKRSPHFNSILNMFKKPKMVKILLGLIEITSMPLKPFEKYLAIDSTGFSTSEFSRWFDAKTQEKMKLRQWRKVHLICGTKTNIIGSVTVSDGYEADSPHLKNLVENVSKNFDMEELSGDKAYSSRKNLDIIARLGCVPYIPFKKSSRGYPRGCKMWSALYTFFYNNYEEFMKHYHRRSNVESTFSMLKRNFGKRLRTRKIRSQMCEILMKCLCHNLSVLIQKSFEFGFEIDFDECAKKYYAQS